jgi:surface antigen
MEGYIYIVKKSKRQNKKDKKGLRFAYLVPILLLIFSILTQLVLLRPASAGNDDYPATWKNAPMDSVLDNWKEWNRECTSFVAWRLHSKNQFEMPFNDNAINWKTRAQNMGYAANSTPAVGAVAWFTYGHVAWVESVNANGTVTIEQYNADRTGHYSETTIAASTVSAYIHFKDIKPGRMMIINGGGAAYAKDNLADGWSQETAAGDATSIAVGGNYQMIINSCGAVYIEQSIGNSWSQETSCGTAKSVAIGVSGRQMIINSCGAAYAKDTIGYGGWSQMTSCSDTKAIAVGSTGRMMIINGGGAAYAKDNLADGWSQLTAAGDAQAIAVE